MENPIKMDDLGVPLFSETSIFSQILFPQAAKLYGWISQQCEAMILDAIKRVSFLLLKSTARIDCFTVLVFEVVIYPPADYWKVY